MLQYISVLGSCCDSRYVCLPSDSLAKAILSVYFRPWVPELFSNTTLLPRHSQWTGSQDLRLQHNYISRLQTMVLIDWIGLACIGLPLLLSLVAASPTDNKPMAEGFDISEVEGDVDFAQQALNGASFVYIRATIGNGELCAEGRSVWD